MDRSAIQAEAVRPLVCAKEQAMSKRRPPNTQASEHAIQSAYFEWVRLVYPGCKLIYAVPNAAKRGPALASWMKAEGLTAGMPDINIDIGRTGYHGMRIETKSFKGILTDEQKEAHEQLEKADYYVVVCRDTESMIEETKFYLRGWKP